MSPHIFTAFGLILFAIPLGLILLALYRICGDLKAERSSERFPVASEDVAPRSFGLYTEEDPGVIWCGQVTDFSAGSCNVIVTQEGMFTINARGEWVPFEEAA